MTTDIDPTKFPRNAPKCNECEKRTSLSVTDVAYPDEPELHGKPLWLCECGAFSRCRPGTLVPSGRPAGRETRSARAVAYSKFKEATGRIQARTSCRPYRASALARCDIYDRFGIGIKHSEFGWLTKDEADLVAAAFESVK